MSASFQALLRGADPAFRRFLIFVRLTGWRPHLVQALRWRDVRLEQGSVLRQRQPTAAKTLGPRVIPLPARACRLLAWMHRHCPAARARQDFVFLTSRGLPYNPRNLASKILQLRRRAGLYEVTGGVKLYDLIRNQP